MLGFTRSLLEYCSSRNLFNSYEHMKSFLGSRDVSVVSGTLELLALPARKLEAQQSLRKTFQETIGVEELAVLAGLNHPPFIEFHGMRTKPVDLGALRGLVQELAQDQAEFHLVRLMAMSTYLLFMATLDIELDSSLFASQPTVIGDVARSLSVPDETPMATTTLRRETAVIGLLRAALKVPSKSSEVVYALGVSAAHLRGRAGAARPALPPALPQRLPGLPHGPRPQLRSRPESGPGRTRRRAGPRPRPLSPPPVQGKPAAHGPDADLILCDS
jgi:hypothetical protein